MPGDIIVGIGGRDIADSANLSDALDAYAPGETITIRVLRDGNAVDVPATLADPRL